MLERRTLPGGPTALVSTILEDAGFLVAFTERTGGVSEGAFGSLNLGLGTDDDPAHVFENRRRLIDGLGLDLVAGVRQVHGTQVVPAAAGDGWHGFGSRRRDLPTGDALVTSDRGLGLVVMTADCVPIALAAPDDGRLAVVHAGWRGVAGGIVGAAVHAFPRPERVLAAVGPGVGPDHYEIGPEVADAVDAGASGHAVVSRFDGRLAVDLGETIERTLDALGVRVVERSTDCTACSAERFFSHRRDGRTGRQGLIAARIR